MIPQMQAHLVLVLASCVWGHTLVQFQPSVGFSPQQIPVAAGFAYAFHAPVNSAKSIDAASANSVAPSLAKSFESNAVIDKGYDVPVNVAYNPIVQTASFPNILKTQYHSQDELGQYAFGYVHNDASHHEERTLNGGVSGSYSYYDDTGNKQTAKYIADHLGYRIEASNLPPAVLIPVAMTPEVKAATRAHFRAVEEAKALKRSGQHIHVGIGDTPEVAAARAAHLKAFNEIKERMGKRHKRSAHRPHAYGGHQKPYSGQYSGHGNKPYQGPLASHAIGIPVTPTPEVQAAANAHLHALHAAHKYNGNVHVGIPNTPAVEAAQQAHFYAYDKIQREHAKRW